MVPFTLFSEKYPPTGGMSGNAIRRNLGRSRLDNLSVLIREAVQNAWDARLDPDGSICFDACLGSLLHDQVRFLKTDVLKELPEGHPLEAVLRNPLPLRTLILQDRGTFGLNGPVFHVPKQPGMPRNFMRFLRDIGRGGSEALSGGTYGFGKSCLFTSSEVSTILVHTRFRESHDGPPAGERFIVASLCNPPEDESLTGRHWWGLPAVVAGAPAVAPAEGRHAARLARILGFPPFGEDETGTSIMILKPRVWESDGISLTAEQIAETMTCWSWPRMLPRSEKDPEPYIRFSVWGDDGSRVGVPDPGEVAHLSPFVQAFKAWRSMCDGRVDSTHGCRVVPCETFRPQSRVGYVAMGVQEQPQVAGWSLSSVDNHPLADILGTSEAPPRIRHIALMRSTWQVIKYLDCERTPPDARKCYGGIFIVDPDREGVEEAFAQSEPPSHDDWLEGSLSRKVDKTYVKAHRRAIETAVEQLFEGEFPDGRQVKGGSTSLAALSHDLSLLLDGVAGTSSNVSRRPAGAPSRPSFSLRTAGSGRLEQQGVERVFILPFHLNGVLPDGGIRVQARVSVLLDGGGCEKEAPSGSKVPRILRWEDGKGTWISEKADCEFRPGSANQARVVVGIPDDSLVKVVLFTEPC